jgi:hypothetical protein
MMKGATDVRMNSKNLELVACGHQIEFLCHKEDLGVMPAPRLATKFFPSWFKTLEEKIPSGAASTVKRCMPFLDSMALGFIIPLAADVEFTSNEDGSEITYTSDFHRSLVERHDTAQINGEKHPDSPAPPLKFMNYWAIKVPAGYSVLFIPPLNRADRRFECFSGLVDCDGYFEFINFPFIFYERNYVGVVKAGTPLVQVIPIKRSDILKQHAVCGMGDEDLQLLQATREKRRAYVSDYRDNVRGAR